MKNAVMQFAPQRSTRKGNRNRDALSKAEAFLGSLRGTGGNDGASVTQFCDAYALTQETFTRLTGFSPRAVANLTFCSST